ncbi:MAG: ABC transporter permease [Coriobacteriia bacterium]|nr:ABC transporter permease [Coriobacteriia bacterium]
MLAWRHVWLSVGGMALGALIGVPLGILSARMKPVRAVVIPVVSIIQTVPSLALFGLLMVVLTAVALPSIGTVPTLIALTLYALLPIVRNTYLGIAGVDPAIVDAGLGMGMSRRELLWKVELPLALPLLIEGLRSALVLTVGIAAVMAIAGAMDLGTIVFYGAGLDVPDLVLLGALPMVVLAILADQAMRALEVAVVSPGIRERQQA